MLNACSKANTRLCRSVEQRWMPGASSRALALSRSTAAAAAAAGAGAGAAAAAAVVVAHIAFGECSVV